ncbi:MAG: hypothetical protein M3416_03785 [Acidobacteriota bacterium]|nr:hypothetical protein [Acidobacteriota bacterium]
MVLERLNLPLHGDLSISEEVIARCRASQTAEESGNLEGARAVLKRWQRVGERPDLDALSAEAKAELLLRVGMLTSRLGSAKKLTDPQEIAKDLITESIRHFEEAGLDDRVLDAHIYIAACCQYQSRFDDARVILRQVLDRLPDEATESAVRARIWLGIVENKTQRYHAALEVHKENRSLIGKVQSEYLKGTFHNLYATTLEETGQIEEALLEYAGAGICYENIGNLRYKAVVDNNTSNLFYKLKKYQEAHEYALKALAYFESNKDVILAARVNETRTKILTGEGRYFEALKVIKPAVRTLEESDQPAILAEALVTYGIALSRTNNAAQARGVFERAAHIAREIGDREGAGRALLALLEESPHLPLERARAAFQEARDLLAGAQDGSINERLLDIAGRILSRMTASNDNLDLDSLDENQVPDETFWRGFSLAEAKREHERKLVRLALLSAGGNALKASKLLGMKNHQRIYQLIDEYDLRDLQPRQHQHSIIRPKEADPPVVKDICAMFEFELPQGVGAGDVCIAHQIHDDTLRDKGVSDGDWVLIVAGPVEDGDWVGVDAPGEPLAVGRLTRDGRRAILTPANDALEPVNVSLAAASIEGKIVGRFKAEDVKNYREGEPVKTYPF